jgi:hypothetical protein
MKYIKYSSENWFAPWYVIDSLGSSVGSVNIKGHKELWIAAMYAIARSSIDGSEWWVQFNENDPPDARIMKKLDSDSIEVIDVECFEISSFNNDETLVESVKRKVLKNGVPRQYGKDTVLAGFVRRTSVAHLSQADLIKQLNPNCGSVSLLIDESIDVTTRTWVQMFPEYQKVVFDFKLSGKKQAQTPYLHLRRKGVTQSIPDNEAVQVKLFPKD